MAPLHGRDGLTVGERGDFVARANRSNADRAVCSGRDFDFTENVAAFDGGRAALADIGADMSENCSRFGVNIRDVIGRDAGYLNICARPVVCYFFGRKTACLVCDLPVISAVPGDGEMNGAACTPKVRG